MFKIIFFLISFTLFLVDVHSHKAEAYCPDTSTCNYCPDDWIYPNIGYTGTQHANNTCDITFYWDWNYLGGDEYNPLLVFLCQYDHSESCNVAHENTCGSCQTYTINGLDLSRDPSISYSDSCGNVLSVPIQVTCEGRTIPPTTTGSYSSTSTIPPVVTTSGPVVTTNGPVVTTTNDPNPPFCPSSSECSGCPLDFNNPVFTFDGSSPTEGLCDVTISWKFNYNTEDAPNPSLNFVCIYGANGEYCEEKTKTICGSCESVTFSGLDKSLNPYIDYLDTCSNVYQFNIGDNCQRVTNPPQVSTSTSVTTNNPSDFCPELSRCVGCPSNLILPTFNQKGTIVAPDNCTVDITWNWEYPQDDASNMRMVFLCKYPDGGHCQPLLENVCSTCQHFTIANIQPSGSPRIDYSDTCGNIITYAITEDCF